MRSVVSVSSSSFRGSIRADWVRATVWGVLTVSNLVVLTDPRTMARLLPRRHTGHGIYTTSRDAAYGWALALLIPLLLTSWLAITLIPAEVLDDPGVTIARLTSVGAGVGVVLRALGEEVLFRGLLGGVFMRWLGFFWGEPSAISGIHRPAPRASLH